MDREQAMKPRVLVVEDDPVSRAYFVETLAGLPLAVDAVARCDEALERAAARPHALWLVDAHLPDGEARALVPRMRAHDPGAVAVAHTASRDPALHAALRAAGCIEVLVKPVAVARLQDTAGRFVSLRVRETRPAGWDDAGARCALGGDPAHVAALRSLFLDELPGAVRAVDAAAAAGDPAAMRAVLHRLASACALTGAGPLGDAVRRLHATPTAPGALDAFRHAAGALSPL